MVRALAEIVQTPLFHITDVTNLAAIAGGGAILSDAALAERGGPPVNIGYDHIKRRRMTEIRVTSAGNRFVGEFVPFYFCPRSPMLFVVNKGRTGRPQGCQRTILHLVTSVESALNTGAACAYSDGNAGAAYPNFYGEIELLDQRLNWTAINERANWGPVTTQKSAEFLVADAFPWGSIRGIGCFNEEIAHQVREILEAFDHRPVVHAKPSWYY